MESAGYQLTMMSIEDYTHQYNRSKCGLNQGTHSQKQVSLSGTYLDHVKKCSDTR